MSLRKEVFLGKVLQRLYPAAPKAEQLLDTAVPNTEPPSASPRVKLKPHKGTGSTETSGFPGKKVYTVLPPPEDYRPSSDGNPERMSATDGTAVDLSASEDSDVPEDPVRKKRKRRRKRKADAAAGGASTSPQRGAAQGRAAGDKGRNGQKMEGPVDQERLSKSKKRKLKKKRQTERLRSLGLAPQFRALEFTYRQEAGEEEEEETEEENGRKAEEVLDFLRTTWSIYLSDRSCATEKPSLSLSTAESLFTRLSEGTASPAAVPSLCRLRALLGLRDAEQLNTALQEFGCTSTLTTDETRLVSMLFHYWMTDVLPLQSEKKT